MTEDKKRRSQKSGAVKNAVAKPMAVVAIGASAGGLEALQEFFRNIPPDTGMGFVVVTHVQPNRESLLPELLANVSSIPVAAGEDGMEIEPDKIIVAKDSLLSMKNGVLYTENRDSQPELPFHPIDHFFRSLADDIKERAICIILSGSGNDGTIGLKAVKAVGGMVMVQEPGEAKYNGMPQSAVATRMADYVLPVKQLTEELIEYCKGPFLKVKPQKEKPELAEDVVGSVLSLLRRRTGQDFTCYKKSTMSRRIEKRMNVHRIEKPDDYLRYLLENAKEVEALMQELLISVTSFFRDPEAFEALGGKAIPKLLSEHADGETIRVWIPGCATGEEAYSVAILLTEQINKAKRHHDIQIFATDLDGSAIELARKGLYSEGITADVSTQRLSQFFTHASGTYHVSKSIRDMIVFAVQNVISDPPFTRMDLIVCRNLLIYLDSATQQRVISSLHYSLRPGGILFLGSSESAGEASKFFENIDSKHKILRRKETTSDIRGQMVMPTRHLGKDEKVEDKVLPPTAATGSQMVRNIERYLFEQYIPCSIVTDAQGTITYVHGRSGLYLEPEQGLPKNNIVEMAREGLGPALLTALQQVKKEKKEFVRRGIRVRTNGQFTNVDLKVAPLTSPDALSGLILVTLAPASAESGVEKVEEESQEEISIREHLARELQYTKENLQSVIEQSETTNEELKSSNEELQSTNEELQSSNEELETSREEMQSLNEELNTVNAELQSKVNVMTRTSDDMNNLLNSTEIATIFLDNDLRVKRYTEQARDVVRLISSDIGRPLSDLTSSLSYPELNDDCQKVLATLIPKEREVQDEKSNWHLVRLIPYRTSENVIDGLVMTIVDINKIKQAQLQAHVATEYFESIVQTVREPLIVLDGDLRVVSANESFYDTFGTVPKQTEKQLIYEVGNHQWDIPELRRLLEEVLPKDSIMKDFMVEHDFPKLGHRKFMLNARQLRREDKKPELILLAFEDITGSEPQK